VAPREARMRGRCTLALAVLLSVVPALAEEPLTLEEARIRATDRALEVSLARWDAEAARGTFAQWTGAALPSVTGFFDLSTGAGRTAFGFDRPVATQWGLGVRGSVGLVDPATWAAAAAARRSQAGQEATIAWARVRAREQATALFARVRAEHRVAEALSAARADAEADADAVAALVDAGLRPPSDGARTRADAMDLAARSIEARGQAVAACAALQDLLALRVDGACDLAELPPPPAPALAEGDHPALVASAEALASAEASRASAVASQLPTVSADGTVGAYGTPEEAPGVGWSAGVSVDVPLRVLGEGRGELVSARAAEERAEDQLDGQRRSLSAARIGAEAEWEAAVAALDARRGSLEAADAALRLIQERYRAGLTDVSGLLDSRRARIDAEIGVLRAEARLWAALAAVESARGVR